MRPTTLTVLAAAFFLCYAAAPSEGQGAERRNHRISITIDGSTCFALPVSVDVIYENGAEEPWELNIPTYSKGVSIQCQVVGTEQPPHEYAVDQKEAVTCYDRFGARIVPMTAPPSRPRMLVPYLNRRFMAVLEPGSTGQLIPARYTIWIQDREQELESNRLEFALRFTRESITACLDVASDTERRDSERVGHAKWLQKVMPGLELNWQTKNKSPEGIARRNAKVAKELDAFRAFLKDPKNGEAIRQAIDRINQEAGLPTNSAGNGREAEQKDHAITVSIEGSKSYALPVSAEVTYRNNGNEPWTFNTPTHSRGASILYRIVGTEGLPSGYTLGAGSAGLSFGKQGERIVSVYAPMPKPRTLEPGQTYVFTVPLAGPKAPANWTVWIKDGEQKLESSRTELPLRFTRDSLIACLEIASDTTQRGSRATHAEWLQKVMPDLELSWRATDRSPEGIARRNAKVDKELNAFRAFLKDPKNEQAIQQAINRINREAGLRPERP